MSALNVMPLPIPTVTGPGEQQNMDMFDSVKGWCTTHVTLSRTHKVLEKTEHSVNASGPSGSM